MLAEDLDYSSEMKKPMGKRIFDVVAALLGLVLLSPLLVAIALGVKLTSPGPIVISTLRVGRGGKLFRHYRFRTMEAPAPGAQGGEGRDNIAGGTSGARGSMPRKTRFGRIIGNLSLDDLPTLVNVLTGDMSIVGPRPEVPEKVDLRMEEWRTVLSVRPGLMGLGTLTYLSAYNSTPVSERIMPEVYYVKHCSLGLDAQIIARTIYWLARTGHVKGRF